MGIHMMTPLYEMALKYGPLEQFENYTLGANNMSSFFGIIWKAQTFTPQKAHLLTLLKLKLGRSGEPETVTISLRDTDSEGKPTGDDLTSVEIDGNALVEDAYCQWEDIELPSYLLKKDSLYAIVIRAESLSLLNVGYWRFHSQVSTYTRGKAGSSLDGGVTWSMDSGPPLDDNDYMFEEWGRRIL